MQGEARHREADRGKVLASSSTLNRLELSWADSAAESRYKKFAHDPEELERFFVDAFLDSFAKAPDTGAEVCASRTAFGSGAEV
ncbi:MAG TPA: hypothetical protein QF901_10325, partial [Gammaproteobacteria bacterium]|nr:hypothetical protein [Gammaproteobacteria bacterium]